MLSNFTLQDILGTTFAFCLFPFVIVFPGYVFGWIFELFEFRARLLPARFAIALILSVAISPILYYLVTSWFSLNAALVLTILIALVFVILVIYERPPLPQDWPWRTFLGIFLGWFVLAMFSLVDFQWGSRELYFSVASFDHTTRVSIIDAMTRTGVPPVNPSYYPGHSVKLTFLYFFWYILGSLVDFFGGKLVDARAALFASSIWCGVALMALIAFYLRLRDGRNAGKIWRRTFVGMASLSISGLDIIPAVAIMLYGHGAIGDIEHWNEIISAWVGSLLWVPHHVAGLVAGMVAVMLVHSAHTQVRTRQFTILVFSGISFASALGLSVWVTFVFVSFWGIWMLLLYFQKRQRTILFPMFVAGVAAFLFAGPFLFGLMSGGEGSSLPIVFDIRSFRLVDALLVNSSYLWRLFIRLVVLPINYFFEFGFYFLVALIWLRSNKSYLRENPYYLAEVLLLGVSFFIGTFMRSTLIENNDLGWRSWLPGQFVLLIWGVDVLDAFFASPFPRFAFSQRTKYNLILLAALGVSTSILDVTLLRFAYYFVFGSEAGHQFYSARLAYSTINEVLPKDAVVQYNPSEVVNHPVGLYGMRQSAISDRTAYGVPSDLYSAKVAEVSMIFNMENVQNWDSLDILCDEHFIDVIVIVNGDPLWKSLNLLEKQRVALYRDDYNSVFFCGSRLQPLPVP